MTPNSLDSLVGLDSYLGARIVSTSGSRSWAENRTRLRRADDRTHWQTEFRSEFSTLLGGVLQWDKPELHAEIIDVVHLDGYRRESITFTSRTGLTAFAYFLIPDQCVGPKPAMLCLPGHGRGIESIVGIAEDGSQRPLGQPAEYASDYALGCVRLGFPTLALEMVGFGVRRDRAAKDQGSGASSCHRAATTALAVGETLAGWRTFDAIRAIDYLQTRSEIVSADHIGIMGISGGAMIALFAAALDTRIRAVVLSGYWNTFQQSILSIMHCVDNYVPGLSALCEMPDLASLIAPRPFFVENGTDDPIFPISAFRQACKEASAIYQDFESPGQFEFQEFDGGHQFHGDAAYPFLTRALQGPTF